MIGIHKNNGYPLKLFAFFYALLTTIWLLIMLISPSSLYPDRPIFRNLDIQIKQEPRSHNTENLMNFFSNKTPV